MFSLIAIGTEICVPLLCSVHQPFKLQLAFCACGNAVNCSNSTALLFKTYLTAFVALKLSALIVQPSVSTIVPPFALAVTKYPTAIVLLVPVVAGVFVISVFPSYQAPLVGVGNAIDNEFVFGNCNTFNALQPLNIYLVPLILLVLKLVISSVVIPLQPENIKLVLVTLLVSKFVTSNVNPL